MGSEAEGRIIQLGRHRVRHGNIYERDGIAELVNGSKADIFYSDPPWGSGNLRFWDTMNKKMNVDAAEYSYGFDVVHFLHTVLDTSVRHTDGFVVIEYGKRWSDKLIELAETKGLHYCAQVETLYKGGAKLLPLDIVVFHTGQTMPINLEAAHHTVGLATVKIIFDALLQKLTNPGERIGMDPCCGMGYTAQACIDAGMSFIGNELNWKRLEKTIARLKKAEGL